MKFVSLIFVFAVIASLRVQAQVTNEVTPPSWSLTAKSEVAPIVLPAIDVDKLLLEDEQSSNNIAKPLRIGEAIEVNIDLYNAGAWTVLENGDRIWRQSIVSRGAKFMKATLDLYSLPQGAELFLYNDSRTDKIGPYTARENQENGVLGTWIVEGDHLWIEYYEPAAVSGFGRVSIDAITHGYVELPKQENFGKLNESGNCNVDVLCDPNAGSTGDKDWDDARDKYINSVARIIYNLNGSTFTCTGSMIANTGDDTTPYFLTANHCLGDVNNGAGSSYDASDWAFGFQWFTNTPDCATTAPTQGPQQPTRVLTGAALKANNDNSDMALFLLSQEPEEDWNIFYAGWDHSGDVPQEQLGIHHPGFDIMKLARNDQPAESVLLNFNGNSRTQVWQIADWDYGVTEGGSSGSFILNENDQIVGQLAGGFAACSGTNDNNDADFYGKFDVSWDFGSRSSQRLRDWLDPEDTGVEALDGSFFKDLEDEMQPPPPPPPNPEFDIFVFPNPSSGRYFVVSEEPTTYEIFNLNGQLIVEGSTNDLNDVIDISYAAKGIYIARVKNAGNTIVRKLIKQ
ncbi:T9SS type A sorting domain-containing protein [Nonlabens ponticola]|uniref:T9SS type A sorting domain-containing protein n=1 Tax=Nonlabens ponticola TaxID=2496866 RepID=A0A3S9MWI0_9FLAO|nr:T9SS type A sorting domain-containing protein [Nonlabens ponticola]AZQ43575.1 T9SS type A sorting domain-containing protein [Nonlabens ponticola]